jgi:hypothetical protein
LTKLRKNLYIRSKFTKEEKKAFKHEKRERKNKNKKDNGLIFGLGILGVAVIVLLCFLISKKLYLGILFSCIHPYFYYGRAVNIIVCSEFVVQHLNIATPAQMFQRYKGTEAVANAIEQKIV